MEIHAVPLGFVARNQGHIVDIGSPGTASIHPC
jgi:hypothetical protein